MNVVSVSQFVLGAAAAISAAEAFSPWFGAAVVAIGLIGVLLAVVLLARSLSRPVPVGVAAPASPSMGNARFAAPQTALASAQPDPALEVALQIAMAALLVGASACWRLVREVSFESLTPLLLAGLVGGALLTALALKLALCDRRSAGLAFAGFALMAAAAFGWLDVASDREPPLRSQVAVTGRDGTRLEWLERHELELGVGATRVDWHRVVVDAADRRHLFLGSTACLEEHEGLFEQRWAAVHPCAVDAELTAAVAARRWIVRNQRSAGDFPPLMRQVLAGQWQEVDRELTDLQRRFEAGKATDLEVDDAFEAFHIATPLLDAPLQDWIARAPRSAAAHVAAAEHARAQSDVLSRGGFGWDVSPAFNSEGQRAAALRYLDEADALLPRPSSLNLLLRYRMTVATRAAMDDWLDRAVAANPDDLLMRREYLLWHPICPCRDGVRYDAAMSRVLASPVPPQVKEALTAVRLYERAVDIEGSEQAATLYRQVISLHAFPQETYTANINLAVFLAAHGSKDAAIERLGAAIAILPGNVHAHTVRGGLHEELGQYPQAIADDLVDARRKDLDAQHAAGRILLWGKPGVPADLREAARWIAEASYLGESEARGLLRSRADLLALVAKQPVRPLGTTSASEAIENVGERAEPPAAGSIGRTPLSAGLAVVEGR